jgi:hypothetical protein
MLINVENAPINYDDFVSFLRIKDAKIQSLRSTTNFTRTQRDNDQSRIPSRSSGVSETPISQGGTGMDLDVQSQQKGPDGKLTTAAKNARRTLGRCLRCNKAGHYASACPLGNTNVQLAVQEVSTGSKSVGFELKE